MASDAFMADVEDLPVQEREVMPRFMLDTDTCSYIMKRSHPFVLKRLQSVPSRRLHVGGHQGRTAVRRRGLTPSGAGCRRLGRVPALRGGLPLTDEAAIH